MLQRSLSEAQALPVGSGSLELGLLARARSLGGALQYRHRITQGLSAFAQAGGGLERVASGNWAPGWSASAGLRFRW